MGTKEFYNYIMENYTLDDTAARLVKNIIEYIKVQDFVDAEDAQYHLKSLFNGAFGIEEHETWLYGAEKCERCGKYVARSPETINYDEEIICGDCE